LDIVVAIGAGAQIVIGVILIYQLIAYRESNELTRQSIDLNRKTLIINRTPWVWIEPDIEVKLLPGGQLMYSDSLENTSDAPAFNIRSQGGSFYPTGQDIEVSDVTTKANPTCLMPHSIVSEEFVSQSTQGKKMLDDIVKGDRDLRITDQYSDIFGNNITVSSDFRKDPKTQHFVVIKTFMKGYPTY
jgi:hypothetical protein